MGVRPELGTLGDALAALGCESEPVVLADHPGRRRVVRVGDMVVKAFAAGEAMAHQRETSGLRATAGSGLAAEPVASGPLWTATRWVDGVNPMRSDIDIDLGLTHRVLGQHLARLHEVDPSGMRPRPLVERLRDRLQSPPTACPSSMVSGLARMVGPWMALMAATGGRFVHGDWGLSNILVARDDPTKMLAVVDFEDSHVGDPAEDFKWQVLAGPRCAEYEAMSLGYAEAGGSLGPNAAERLALAGTELCLGVLKWDLPADIEVDSHSRCLQTLDELLGGQLPEPPHPWLAAR